MSEVSSTIVLGRGPVESSEERKAFRKFQGVRGTVYGRSLKRKESESGRRGDSNLLKFRQFKSDLEKAHF